MNFATTPPCSSTTARIVTKKRSITRRSDSGSVRSPSGVDPTMSTNTMLTVLRASPSGSGCRRAPQAKQKRARSGFSSPHDGQPSGPIPPGLWHSCGPRCERFAELAARSDVELLVDVGQMRLDGLSSDKQRLCDLRVGPARGGEIGNPPL